MHPFRCLRVVARPAATQATLLRPSIARLASPPRICAQPTRSISLLSPRRPVLRTSTALPTPGSATTPAIPAPDAFDLASKITSHPALGSMQIRCGPRDTYNPSHIVRKRRHGFLSRIRTKKGRKLIMRRLKKGRWNLSH
ncbi:ribosomal protein L34-domain-containing protein [Massariosphaeria phaeospora]|uniref:Large ribosomal subunit protein bL34m n=1 Tax=Massariosphaeria phaeospora TaxID=100035 RepID=A0A7C8MBW9_9PLEO|nr:ribosomal protein L34-domain-containing protein [Massariosphaeria phaeospora]